MIRISSGWCGGMQLASPVGMATRPTASRIREAVLNSLQTQISGARVLDLFAGSGAVGIEAVSRGAAGCVFVERDKKALLALKENIAELKRRGDKQQIAVDPLTVIATEVAPALERLAKQGQVFDIVWADPPYPDTIEQLPAILRQAQHLCPSGVVVIESGTALPPNLLGTWQVDKVREYGDTMISFLQAAR